MAIKRQSRCGYCWGTGHNRLSCPKVKEQAAAGDAYAQRQLERSKVKQCSYCKSTDHIKSSCISQFTDERREALASWVGILGLASVIQEKKIANGAFVYGPILHRWNKAPQEEGKTHTMGNFSVTKIDFSSNYATEEFEGVIHYETLTEAPDNTWFSKRLPLPSVSNMISAMPDSIGRTLWLEKNHRSYDTHARTYLEENFQVIIEAPQEEVDKAVAELVAKKPMIVDFEDMKAYQSAKRKLAKEQKQAAEANL